MRQRRGSLTPAWQSRIGVFKLLQGIALWVSAHHYALIKLC